MCSIEASARPSASTIRASARPSRMTGSRSTGPANAGAGPRATKATAPEPKTMTTDAIATHNVTPRPAARASSNAAAGTDAIDSTVE